jgi:hypothetical protein
MSVLNDFNQSRIQATREFAHTMIVVDDDAWKPMRKGAEPKPGLRRPGRSRAATRPAIGQSDLFDTQHALDAEKLVDAAMELGLVCSVIRPVKGKSIKDKVSAAARRADIVCLDWELHNDGGDSATRIINEIVRSDEKRNGRLRLIAIYTGNTQNDKILGKIHDSFTEAYRRRIDLKRDDVSIWSNHGLRIVRLFKAHGVQLTGEQKKQQVGENDLPRRLQEEFALLAGGLLSSVALATIASIRDSTHHVLAKITGSMDAPYFHHRSLLPMAGDAEEYGVEVVLSDLKSAVDKAGVAHRYAGPDSIAARIRDIASDAVTFSLCYQTKGVEKKFDVSVENAIRLVTDGFKPVHDSLPGGDKPGKSAFEEGISSLFTSDRQAAHFAMRQFAVLTGVSAHPGSHLYKSGIKLPKLGLGTVLQDPKGNYLLCLQASCDSVRVQSRAAFLFVPLAKSDDKPDHVVPAPEGVIAFIDLTAARTAYAESISLQFDPDNATQTVVAKKVNGRRGLYFSSANRKKYKWVADLKNRRALRTAQKMGQSMTRLGFDEFEPFRKD